ncbi:MAG: nuclear transport factor 2 family protein [Bacteroidota bacterium]|nr:nuclear transport factor 2 family protein [Bacteroidota bacterium]
MKKIVLLLGIALWQLSLCATVFSDSSLLIALNQQIDNHVVAQDTIALDELYAADFVFSHGSGKIEGKKGWFTSVAKGSFISRQHDSVTAELHPNLAILRGKLSVHKKAKEKTDRYYLYYIRVYAYRDKRWQMISHITTSEYHQPAL